MHLDYRVVIPEEAGLQVIRVEDLLVFILDYRVLIPEDAGLQVVRVEDLRVFILDYRVLIWETVARQGRGDIAARHC